MNDKLKRAFYAVENPLFHISDASFAGTVRLESKDEIRAGLKYAEELEAENQRLTERLDWLQGVLNRQAVETEGLAEALGACSQARAELLDRVRGVK
jgi:hypothetical protein